MGMWMPGTAIHPFANRPHAPMSIHAQREISATLSLTIEKKMSMVIAVHDWQSLQWLLCMFLYVSASLFSQCTHTSHAVHNGHKHSRIRCRWFGRLCFVFQLLCVRYFDYAAAKCCTIRYCCPRLPHCICRMWQDLLLVFIPVDPAAAAISW